MALPRLRNLAGSFMVGRHCVKRNSEKGGFSDSDQAATGPKIETFRGRLQSSCRFLNFALAIMRWLAIL
jgi:hypothetical protein